MTTPVTVGAAEGQTPDDASSGAGEASPPADDGGVSKEASTGGGDDASADGGATPTGCRAGATCTPAATCGVSSGAAAYACWCDATGHYVCGAPEAVPPCPADTGSLGTSCGSPPSSVPRVVCATVKDGDCSMFACNPSTLGSASGWGGACTVAVSCPAPHAAVCGQACVPSVAGCQCDESVFDATLKTCGCIPTPSGGGLWACAP